MHFPLCAPEKKGEMDQHWAGRDKTAPNRSKRGLTFRVYGKERSLSPGIFHDVAEAKVCARFFHTISPSRDSAREVTSPVKHVYARSKGGPDEKSSPGRRWQSQGKNSADENTG
jgi:hypothetical protein